METMNLNPSENGAADQISTGRFNPIFILKKSFVS
jgi:hypothetical protein